jgi:hypothetical protein
MTDEAAQDALDLRFVIVAVRDRAHLDAVLRSLRRTHRCCARAHHAGCCPPANNRALAPN